MTNPLFYTILAFLVISFSIAVVASKNPIYAVFSLIIVFAGTALLLLLFGIEFLAFILLIVYAGAISILFLFVVLLLNIKNTSSSSPFSPAELWLIFAVFLKTAIIFFSPSYLISILNESALIINKVSGTDALFNTWQTSLLDIYIYATTLYTQYATFTVLAGLILLIAMVGAITLTKK